MKSDFGITPTTITIIAATATSTTTTSNPHFTLTGFTILYFYNNLFYPYCYYNPTLTLSLSHSYP